ncbi:hypothetical protein CHARACLAT_011770, partial [Characodon lateralis]|nr:hypothetical protein [Characodon lateralis]
PLQRTLTPIAPYGEIFLYNNPGSAPEKGAKDGLQTGFKAQIKQKKKRKKPKEKRSPPTQTLPDGDGYSTVDMSASMLPRTSMDTAFALTPDTTPVGSVTPGPENESMIMVECDLYSETVKSRGTVTESTQPDISPYACFYGGPKQQVLKVGWLDKLSPQGNCVFQRRWVRFDGESLAYYNNEKLDRVRKGARTDKWWGGKDSSSTGELNSAGFLRTNAWFGSNETLSVKQQTECNPGFLLFGVGGYLAYRVIRKTWAAVQSIPKLPAMLDGVCRALNTQTEMFREQNGKLDTVLEQNCSLAAAGLRG